MFFRRLLYFLLLILLPALSAYPEALYSQENEIEKADALNEKAEQLYKQGRYADALPLAQRVMEIREKVLGPEHTDTAESLNDLAGLYYSPGGYPKGRLLKSLLMGFLSITSCNTQTFNFEENAGFRPVINDAVSSEIMIEDDHF
jgi:tetratricopeptide (TPR) repeat protein